MGSCAAPSAKGDDKFITTDYLQQCLTDFDLLQLPIRVLVEAADADIANALTLQGASKGKSVRMKSITLGGLCQ